jgi:two-component system cell cycle response regulator
MRVVFVDPSRTAAKCVTRLLEAGNHDVKTFADGLEALAYIKSDPDVSALITSAEPLSISGLELCWQARLIATSHRPMYLIMMSATTDGNMLIEALDSGADDFISKPPVAEELYARLRAAERFCQMQRELIRLATTDSLTGTFNRRAFFERAAELCARSEAGEMLSAVVLDIDHFKKINDSHGHGAGDEVLRIFAQRMGQRLRSFDLISRLGGEEFVVVLPDVSRDMAIQVADRLRRGVCDEPFEIGGSPGGRIPVTVSIGGALIEGEDVPVEEALRRSDAELYRAKENGRNRCYFSGIGPVTEGAEEGGPEGARKTL